MTGSAQEPPVAPLELRVDGVSVQAPPGSTVLEACDLAGRYVPRLCNYPGLQLLQHVRPWKTECGLCAVRTGDGTVVLACLTPAVAGMEIVTDDEGLRELRLRRLGEALEGHPSCACCAPTATAVSGTSAATAIPRRRAAATGMGAASWALWWPSWTPRESCDLGAGPFDREAVVEGPIRREPGLCVGCGRCVVVCAEMEGAGRSLQMVDGAPAFGRRPVAVPRGPSLRAAGCTFCGRCVLVCPTGALTAPGEAGERWLERRRETSGLAAPVLPPEPRMTVTEARERLGGGPGVLQLLDRRGEVLLIAGVPDLAKGLVGALDDLGPDSVAYARAEEEPMYTQRESELLTRYSRRHGSLPPGNDLGEDLFDDDDDE